MSECPKLSTVVLDFTHISNHLPEQRPTVYSFDVKGICGIFGNLAIARVDQPSDPFRSVCLH